MNLAVTIEMYGGGPGSGCNPLVGRCGRPKEEGGVVLETGKPSDQELQQVHSWSSLVMNDRENYSQAHIAGVVAKDAAEDIWRDAKDVQGVVARDGHGDVVGIASIYDGTEYSKEPYVAVNYLATHPHVIQGVWDDINGAHMHGVGTKLLVEAAKVAANKNAELTLVALKGAVPFYEKIGMHKTGRASFYWTKDEVKEIAKQAS